MSRLFIGTLTLLAVLTVLPWTSQAASPHFAQCTATADDPILTLEGKIAGLGTQTQPLQLEATATAICLDPTAAPTPVLVAALPVTASQTFPPPRGKVTYELVLEAPFAPPCDAPLTVVFAQVEVCDRTHADCCTP